MSFYVGGTSMFGDDKYEFTSVEAVLDAKEEYRNYLIENIKTMPSNNIKRIIAIMNGLDRAVEDVQRLNRIEKKLNDLIK